MLKRTGLCLLFGVVGAAPACGSASDNNFSGPAAAGSSMKGGASGSSGESGTAGKGGTSSTGGSAMGGTGGSTGGTGGTDVGGTGMGGSATQGGSSGDTAMGGTDPGVGGTDPGVGGDPGTGGTDPGMGGTGMTTGGMGGMAGMAGKPGNGGSGGKANCDELAQKYAEALTAARACNADSGKDQCTHTVPSSATCGCDVFVNPDNADAVAELTRLRKTAASCSMPCPQLACLDPGQGECAPDKSSDGLCRSTGAILQ